MVLRHSQKALQQIFEDADAGLRLGRGCACHGFVFNFLFDHERTSPRHGWVTLGSVYYYSG
jgi:hypothetical protein